MISNTREDTVRIIVPQGSFRLHSNNIQFKPTSCSYHKWPRQVTALGYIVFRESPGPLRRVHRSTRTSSDRQTVLVEQVMVTLRHHSQSCHWDHLHHRRRPRIRRRYDATLQQRPLLSGWWSPIICVHYECIHSNEVCILLLIIIHDSVHYDCVRAGLQNTRASLADPGEGRE